MAVWAVCATHYDARWVGMMSLMHDGVFWMFECWSKDHVQKLQNVSKLITKWLFTISTYFFYLLKTFKFFYEKFFLIPQTRNFIFNDIRGSLSSYVFSLKAKTSQQQQKIYICVQQKITFFFVFLLLLKLFFF